MKRNLFLFLIFCSTLTFQVTGQSDAADGAWKLIQTKGNSETMFFTKVEKLKRNSAGLYLNADSTSYRILYVPGCDVEGKRRSKILKGNWKYTTDELVEVRSENRYEETIIVETFTLSKVNSRKMQLSRTSYQEIPVKTE